MDRLLPRMVAGVSRSSSDVSRQHSSVVQSVEHLDTAFHTDGSVDSGSAAATCADASGGGGGVTRQQSSVVQWVEHLDTALCLEAVAVSVDSSRAWWAEHLDTALLTNASVNSRLAAATYAGVSGGGVGVSRQQSRVV